MRKNVYFRPASQVQSRTVRQKFEAGLCKLGPTLPLEPDFQLILQSVQKADIRCGIVPLGLAEFGVAPIAVRAFAAVRAGIREAILVQKAGAAITPR